MAKETKTVQCYPDDSIINKKIREYESFGWELITNQRCQEYTGQTFDGDGSSTSHYSTFNKLTFSREKASPWYSRVTALESEYNSLMGSAPKCYAYSPSKNLVIYGICGVVIGICVLLVAWSMGLFEFIPYLIAIPIALIAIAVILIVVFVVKKAKYNRDYSNYLSRKRNWENTKAKEAEAIMKKAEAIVNGN